MREVAIVGAGVAGLSVAFELLRRTKDCSVRVYEAEAVPGGNIHTDHVEGFTVEWGPNGFLDNVPETLDLVERLGMAERLLPASQSSKRRFIWRAGRLHEIKANPLAFLASGVLSWPGKLRLMAEPFSDTRPGGDETVFDFAVRHIGAEAAAVLVDAMVSGVFAGNARELSLQSAFPRMHQMDLEYGSLVRAMVSKLRDRKSGVPSGGPTGPAGHLTSFKGGMSDLIDGLTRAVGAERIRCGCPVQSVAPLTRHRFTVRLADGSSEDADAVVLAVPAWHATPLVRACAPEMAAEMDRIPGAPLCVVALGFRRGEVEHPMNGFGFLVPRGEALTILGSLWTSSIFPGRAPEGFVLLRTMVGGAHAPHLAAQSDDALYRLVRDDLRTAMGIAAAPTSRRIYRHRHGIPQYVVGHQERLDRIEAMCRHLGGLYVTGNSYVGIAVNACVRAAGPLAEKVLAELP